MNQSIQRHYDALQSKRSQCPRVHIIWFHSGDTFTIAKEWQWQSCDCQRLDRSEVAFEKGEVVQRRGDAVGGGLVLLLQATETCILQRAILFHANFKRPNHSNYISIETYLNGTMKWEDISFQRTPCYLFSWWYMVLKTLLMFVKFIDDCDSTPDHFFGSGLFGALRIKLLSLPQCPYLFLFLTRSTLS